MLSCVILAAMGGRPRATLHVCAVVVSLSAIPADACSFSWEKGWSPNEIRYRADVWEVRGEFRFVDSNTGDPIAEGNLTLTASKDLLGRIDRPKGKPILTTQNYSQAAVDCSAYLPPLNNTSGSFWIERWPDKNGRYRLFMWKPK